MVIRSVSDLYVLYSISNESQNSNWVVSSEVISPYSNYVTIFFSKIRKLANICLSIMERPFIYIKGRGGISETNPGSNNPEKYSSLRKRLRTHKIFTKDQCFYLNYHKFSIKSYVLDVY